MKTLPLETYLINSDSRLNDSLFYQFLTKILHTRNSNGMIIK